jgi:hypothetical protein
MAELEQPSGPYPVESSISMPIEIRADVVVAHVLSIEIKMDFEWDEAKRFSNLEE